MADHEQRYKCEIRQAKQLGDNYFLLTFRAPEEFSHRPGQHIRMIFTDSRGEFERYYSIANAPNPQNEVQFCILMRDQRVAHALQKLQVGGSQIISQAAGFFQLVDPVRPIVLVAGGTGISPIRAFFQQLTDNFQIASRQRLHLVYGTRFSASIPGKEEFIEYVERFPDNVKLWFTADEDSDAVVRRGLVTDCLAEAVLPSAHYYLCGPPAMMDAVKAKLAELKVTADAIFVEDY